MQQGIELAVRKMMHLCGLWKEWVSEGGMLHHCHGRLQEEWDRERVVVASLMQQGIELAVGKMMHHWAYGKNGLAKEECCITVTVVYEKNGIGTGWFVASLMQHGMELGVGKMIHQCGLQKNALAYGTSCRKDDASLWPTEGMDRRRRNVASLSRSSTRGMG